MIWKIVSGGQTGSDEGGLQFGKAIGIATGGYMPLGFLTENGPRPDFAEIYGMVEYTSPLYPPRTIMNVGASTGTIRFASDFNTAGEKCTLRAIKDLKKPYIDINVTKPRPTKEVAAWVKENNIEVLNVAGNRESTWPGMAEFVRDYLCEVWDLLKEPMNED